MGEDDLIRRASQKEPEAFTQLIQSYMTEIDAEISRLLGKLGNEAEKAGIGKTVIVTAWNKIADFQGGAKRFPAWLGKIVTEICRNLLLEKAKQGNASAFQELLASYTKMVYGIIARYQRLQEQAEDILQALTEEAWKLIPLRFQLTKASFEWLRAQIPDATLLKLKSLTGQGFEHEAEFLNAVRSLIGEKPARQYQEAILACARISGKRFTAWLRIRTTGMCLDCLKKQKFEASRQPDDPTFTDIAAQPGTSFVEQEQAELVAKALRSEKLSVSERHVVSLRLAGLSNKEIAQLPLILFELTTAVLKKLRDAQLPEAAGENLKPLRDQEFLEENAFLRKVEAALGKKFLELYQSLILQYAQRMLTNQEIAMIVFHAIIKIRAILRAQGYIGEGDDNA